MRRIPFQVSLVIIKATNPGESLHLSVLKARTKQTVDVDATPKKSKEDDASS